MRDLGETFVLTLPNGGVVTFREYGRATRLALECLGLLREHGKSSAEAKRWADKNKEIVQYYIEVLRECDDILSQ